MPSANAALKRAFGRLFLASVALLIVLILCPAQARAQASAAGKTGAPEGLFQLQSGDNQIDVQVCAPGILRVDLRPDGEASPPTDTLDPGRSWEQGAIKSLVQRAGSIVVKTARMRVDISKEPFALTVFDASGARRLLAPWGKGGIQAQGLAFEYKEGSNFYGVHGFDDVEDSTQGILRNQGGGLLVPKQGNASGPFLWSSAGFGLLVDSDRGRFDVDASASILRYSGCTRRDLEFFVLVGTPKEMMADLAKISGRPPLFPKWAMGFTNSQWGSDEDEIKGILKNYRAKGIPIDNFTMDFDWKAWGQDNYGEWRWNDKKFPDGASGRFAADMAAQGLKLTGILKPRIHVDSAQGAYATAHGYWWPGEIPGKDYFSGQPVMDLDFSLADCRSWFFEHLKPAFDQGIRGWWNDEADYWQGKDLGEMPALPGSMRRKDGAYLLTGSGSGIWGVVDQFNYSYVKLDGDCSLTAHVVSQDDTQTWADSGVMLRASDSQSSPCVAVLKSQEKGIEMLWRAKEGAPSEGFSLKGPERLTDGWVRLERRGGTVTGFESADGAAWTKLQAKELAPGPLLAGLAVTSDTNSQLSTAVLDHVDLSPSAAAWANADIGGKGGRWQFENMEKSLYEGQRAYSDKRVWSINRSFVLGSQRYAYGMWSGDIRTGWASMAAQRERMLSAVDLGAAKWGMDSGGFYGKPSPENYARWIEFSAFVPIFRVHGNYGQKRQPWTYGPVAEAAAAKAMRLRYELIPYVYSYDRAAHDAGLGLVRPLVFDYPDDPRVANDVDAWMFGDSLLVSPVVAQGEAVKGVYLPAGTWIDYFRGTRYEGGRTLRYPVDPDTWADVPLFIRQGSIIVSQDYEDYVGQKPLLTLKVDVFPSAQPSTFRYYDDDGETYGYEQGRYFAQDLGAQQKGGVTLVTVGDPSGTFDPALRYYLVRIHAKAGARVSVDGKDCPMKPLADLAGYDGEAWAGGRDIYGPLCVVKVRAKTAKKIRVLAR
jgi:alpha-glucosidase (family GH31 glycosyl hydrolase)